MKRLLRLISVALLLILFRPAPAAADLTAFLGINGTPHSRSASGFAVGINVIIIGFEFEYSHTTEDSLNAAPSLKTYSFNGLVETPTRTQLYATIGGEIYRERLGTGRVTSFGTNVGAGIKIPLAGPFRIRLDYRVFNLRGSALYKNPQRFYGGINFSF